MATKTGTKGSGKASKDKTPADTKKSTWPLKKNGEKGSKKSSKKVPVK